MTEAFKPETAEQVKDLVAWAVAEEIPLAVHGHATKRDLGRPVAAAHELHLAGLSGITLYEPEELVLSAGAGTPLAEVRAALAERRQELAFEPPDLAPLFGGAPGDGSLGGTMACNLSGPRRIKIGAARDHFLGFHAVSGRGEPFKSGGRVVKNVTGYDLSKLLAGSFGTLAVMTDLTVKVMPVAEKVRTVLVYGLADAPATAALSQALGSPYEVSGAVHLPAAAAACSAVPLVGEAGGAVTAVRVEGPGPSVTHRCAALRRELAAFGETEELHSRNSAAFWREVRDLAFFVPRPELAIWRVSVAPTSGAAVAARTTGTPGTLYWFDWGGGLLWLGLPVSDSDAGAAPLRAAVAEVGGGHATLLRALEALRRSVEVFPPLEPPMAALTRRVKQGFDPRGVLNPGRMYREI